MSIRLSLTRNALILVGLSLAVTACDREPPQPAQEQGALGGAKASLTGEIDRSHAGELLPAVNVTDPDGNTLNLGAVQGQPILLNLWATWCAPCVVEMPMLDELAEEHSGDLRVLTVSQDLQGAEKVVPFFKARHFAKLQPWLDPENALGFGIGGGVLPTTVMYDSSGQEVWRVVGEYDWSGAAAEEAIQDAIDAEGK